MSKPGELIQEDHRPSLRLCDVERPLQGSCGFHLSRTQWDPYPWVSGVEGGSPAEAAGLTPGDCVLEVNGEDVLGQRICQVADRVRGKENVVSLLLWNAGSDPQTGFNVSGSVPAPLTLHRLSSCLQAVFQLLECPVCLEPVSPPASQCCHGHVLCVRCRARADKCPVCRVPLGPRGRCLLADQLHVLLTATLSQQQPPSAATAGVDLIAKTTPRQRAYIQLHSRLPQQIKSASVENISSQHVTNPIKTRSISTGELPSEIRVSDKPSPTSPPLYNCPYGYECNVTISSSSLSSHLQEHEGPLVQYFLHPQAGKASLRLPLPACKAPGLISLTTTDDRLVFYVKTMDNSVFWLWLAGDATLARRRRFKVTLVGEDAVDAVVYDGDVFALTTPWHEVVRHQRCVRFNHHHHQQQQQQQVQEVLVEIVHEGSPCDVSID